MEVPELSPVRYMTHVGPPAGSPPGPRILFVVDHPRPGPTDISVARCEALAGQLGYRSIDVGALYSWTASSPGALRRALRTRTDIVGPDNFDHLRAAAERADKVVVAWGADVAAVQPKDPGWRASVIAMLSEFDPWCFDVTDGGHPIHVLHVESPALQPFGGK